jgi:Predicted transcriptional regulators
MLQIDPTDAIPIWRQIEEGIRRMVALGSLPAGEVVPSVRDLARDLRVNPATVSKAYQRLTDGGVLTVKRGEGTFVSETAPTMRKSERRSVVREGAEKFAVHALTLGASVEEAVEELEAAFERISKGGKR